MGVLVISLMTVSAAFLLHVILWKIRVPRRQTRAILLIFFGALGAVLASLPVIGSSCLLFGLDLPVHPATYMQVTFFVVAVTLSYMMTYTVVEVDSPSLVMALAIGRAGPDGLSEEDFRRMMSDALLVEPRIRDMVRDGLVRQREDRYELTPKGSSMVRLFIIHRALLGAGKGG